MLADFPVDLSQDLAVESVFDLCREQKLLIARQIAVSGIFEDFGGRGAVNF
jgi:hypothetical protein